MALVDQWKAIRQGLPDRDADLRIANQWRAIQQDLPERWGEARLRLEVADHAEAARAAALLAPANATRRGTVIWIYVSRVGGVAVPDLVLRLLERLDREGIEGKLKLVDATEGSTPAAARKLPTLTEQWDALAAELPEDWSDLWLEIELTSSDHLERGALLLAPVNPARAGERLAFRFRVARRFGYGASPEMMRRCQERLDGEGIKGRLRILRALSDTKPVATQGPVWYVGGRSV
ncbi:MAG TPA: hypothetical protein VHQ98_03610 [Gaiellaceae bacterium]|jgi:hypothetical protein|nr:hypothetical protein [Gaiellaceae bacterium]